jgi:hypothetical protein
MYKAGQKMIVDISVKNSDLVTQASNGVSRYLRAVPFIAADNQ